MNSTSLNDRLERGVFNGVKVFVVAFLVWAALVYIGPLIDPGTELLAAPVGLVLIVDGLYLLLASPILLFISESRRQTTIAAFGLLAPACVIVFIAVNLYLYMASRVSG